MKLYNRNILILALILMALVFVLSNIMSDLSPVVAYSIVALFGLNAWISLLPVYLTKQGDPFRNYVKVMILRLLMIPVILVYIVNQSSGEKVTFLLISFTSFVAFQIAEIAQLMNDRGLLSHKK